MKKFITTLLILCVSLGVLFTATACDKPQNTAQEEIATYNVYAPDGAPAMALAKMMKDNATFNANGNYKIINATGVSAAFTTGEADFIIAPTNAGVKISVSTGNYMLAAVTSWGNLYIVGDSATYLPRSEFNTAAEFLAQFASKTIASIGSGAVPDVTFKKLLTECSVSAEITASDAQSIQAGLANKTLTAAILGEPAVTGTLNNVSSAARLANVSELWAEIIGQDFPQASLFIKKSVIENDPTAVTAFLTTLSASISYLNESATNARELGDYMQSLETSTLKGAVVQKSYLQMQQRFVSAEDAKAAILPFVNTLGVNATDTQVDAIIYKG